MTEQTNPKVTANIIGAPSPVESAAQTMLVIGQMTSAGTAVAGELYESITKALAKTLGGVGGMMFDSIDAAKSINDGDKFDAIFLDDPTGDAAVGNILWAGTATEAGTIEIGVGSYRNGVSAGIAVSLGMTAAQLATAVTAARSTLLDCVAATTTDGTTAEQNNFTANNDGTEGNFLPLWVKGTVDGITYTLTGFTGGTGVPTMTNVLAAIGDARYQTIVAPGSYGVTYLTAHLDPIFNVDNGVQDGVAIVTVGANAADSVTALGSINSKSMVYRCENTETKSHYKGTSQKINNFAASAMIGAIRAKRRSTGSNIVEYVNAVNGPNDATGGPHLSSLPYFNTPMPWPVMPNGFGYSKTEVANIEAANGCVVGNNSSATGIVLGPMRTTYKTNSAGDADVAFEFLNYVDTYSTIREYIQTNLKKDAGGRLTEGALIANYSMENAGSIKAKLLRYCKTLSGAGYVLIEAGETAYKFIEENIELTISKAAGKVSGAIRIPIVTQTREIILNIPFSFSANG